MAGKVSVDLDQDPRAIITTCDLLSPVNWCLRSGPTPSIWRSGGGALDLPPPPVPSSSAREACGALSCMVRMAVTIQIALPLMKLSGPNASAITTPVPTTWSPLPLAPGDVRGPWARPHPPDPLRAIPIRGGARAGDQGLPCRSGCHRDPIAPRRSFGQIGGLVSPPHQPAGVTGEKGEGHGSHALSIF
jgi:hypothetical protein